MWRLAFRSIHRVFSTSTAPKPTTTMTGRRNRDIISISGRVLLLDENRKMVGLRSLTDLLTSVDQRTNNLVQVGETKYKVDDIQLEHVPVCQFMTSKQMYETERQRQDSEKLQKRVATKEKEVRLSTTITEHDLEIKMHQMAELLRKGNRVNIVLKPNKRTQTPFQVYESKKSNPILERVQKELCAKPKKKGTDAKDEDDDDSVAVGARVLQPIANINGNQNFQRLVLGPSK